MSAKDLMKACRAFFWISIQSGLCADTKDLAGHVCSPDCKRIEIKEYPDYFYCVNSGNLHVCGDRACKYAKYADGYFRCPLTGKTLSVEITAIVKDEFEGEPRALTEKEKKDSKIKKVETAHLQTIRAEIEQEQQEILNHLFTAECVDQDRASVYRELLLENIVNAEHQKPKPKPPPPAAEAAAAPIRQSDAKKPSSAKPSDATADSLAPGLVKRDKVGRFRDALKRRVLDLKQRLKEAATIAGNGVEVREGAVRAKLSEMRRQHMRKMARRKFILKQIRREKTLTDTQQLKRATRVITRPPDAAQRKKVIGPYHLNTKRIQRRATINYNKDPANAKKDARDLIEKLHALSQRHFKHTNPKMDTSMASDDMEYAVDRCAAMWAALIRTKVFANHLANISQTRVFLYVIFNCLRDGCDYEGVYSCEQVEYFATRFMDVNVLSSQCVKLEKQRTFKARSLTQVSMIVTIALKEAARDLKRLNASLEQSKVTLPVTAPALPAPTPALPSPSPVTPTNSNATPKKGKVARAKQEILSLFGVITDSA
jgi:hypothetical protein